MRIKRLVLKNIRSYKLSEIVFPKGSILLSGDVGAGKTTILLAIEYALFGLQPGQRGSSLLSHNASEGRVELEMEINNDLVLIERTLRRSSKTINQDYAAITINGTKQELAVTELKLKILELLGYPEEFVKKTNVLYRYTVYSPQEEMKQIILDDPDSRLDTLRHIFGIDRYRNIQENLALVTVKLREKTKLVQGELKDIDVHKSRIQEYNASLEILEAAIDKCTVLVAEKKQARKKVELELIELKKKIDEKQALETGLEKTHIILSNKMQARADLEREIITIGERLAQTTVDFKESDYRKVLDSIAERKKSVEELRGKLFEIKTSIRSLEIRRNDGLEKRKRIFSIQICPTCLQDVSDNHKHNILNETETELSQIDKNIKSLAEQISALEFSLKTKQQEQNIFEAEKSQLEIAQVRQAEREISQKRKQECEKNRAVIDKDTSALQTHVASLKESIFELLKYDALARAKELDLRKSFDEEKKKEIELAENKKEKDVILRELQRVKDLVVKKEAQREEMNYLVNLESWLSSQFSALVSLIEKSILIRLREEFSKLFNKWFILLTSVDFTVHLDENFTPVITRNGFETDYAFLSGGERTAIALAYRLALNQIIHAVHSRIKTRDVIILDEPTDGFSEKQLDKVRDILRELAVTQLIIVSHEARIEGFVDNVLRVDKSHGDSKVISGL